MTLLPRTAFVRLLRHELAVIAERGEEYTRTRKGARWDVLRGEDRSAAAWILALVLLQASRDRAEQVSFRCAEGRVSCVIDGQAHEMAPMPIFLFVDVIRGLIEMARLGPRKPAGRVALTLDGRRREMSIQHVSDDETASRIVVRL